ncbi:alpha-glucosidase C-terminal domain-containing protein, partial [Streptomyces sp. NPDC048441]|uniref:alpha-glucosidase C-terminal domain-containing protein n=1 Tax=Streptomyces sp. NPDC048441 TaxID=3365552 RepID=UPI003710C422
PVELIGGVRFPAIGELPYLLTLAGHGFYWFRLHKAPAPPDDPRRAPLIGRATW